MCPEIMKVFPSGFMILDFIIKSMILHKLTLYKMQGGGPCARPPHPTFFVFFFFYGYSAFPIAFLRRSLPPERGCGTSSAVTWQRGGISILSAPFH